MMLPFSLKEAQGKWEQKLDNPKGNPCGIKSQGQGSDLMMQEAERLTPLQIAHSNSETPMESRPVCSYK